MKLVATVMEPCGAVEPESIEVRYPDENGEAEKTDISFGVNGLNSVSAMGFVIDGELVELDAETTDGSISFEAFLYGDANVDGKVTAADAAMVLRSIVGLSVLTRQGILNAEVDGDCEVTASDAATILRYVVGVIDSFPAQQP